MFQRLFYIFILAIIMCFVFSCTKEEALSNDTVLGVSQEYTVDENSPDSTFVGFATAADKNPWQTLTYNIIDGNTFGAFKIDPITGAIYTNNINGLNYESYPEFNLKIVVQDRPQNFNTDTFDVKIDLKDVVIPTDGLVAYYPLNGNTNDSIAGLNGTGQYIGYFTSRNYRLNWACEFTGYKSYVLLGNAFDYPQKAISLWFKFKKAPAAQSYLYCSDNNTLQNGNVSMFVKNTAGINRLYYNVSNTIDSVEFDLNTWHHAVIDIDTNTVKHYYDMKLVASKNKPSAVKSTDGNSKAILGAGRNLTDPFLEGIIDDVYIYNRALTEKEIGTLFRE